MSITRLEFWDGHIPEAFTWTNMLLIPNSGWWYRGMFLLEVIWKVCVSIVNSRLRQTITLHDVLHGFRKGRGKGMESIEEKMEQQIAGIVHEQLLQVFIDV